MTALLELPTQQSPVEARKRDYVSFSAISTYQQCPLKYYFKYIVGLPEAVVSSSLVLGGAIRRVAGVRLHRNSGGPETQL